MVSRNSGEFIIFISQSQLLGSGAALVSFGSLRVMGAKHGLDSFTEQGRDGPSNLRINPLAADAHRDLFPPPAVALGDRSLSDPASH